MPSQWLNCICGARENAGQRSSRSTPVSMCQAVLPICGSSRIGRRSQYARPTGYRTDRSCQGQGGLPPAARGSQPGFPGWARLPGKPARRDRAVANLDRRAACGTGGRGQPGRRPASWVWQRPACPISACFVSDRGGSTAGFSPRHICAGSKYTCAGGRPLIRTETGLVLPMAAFSETDGSLVDQSGKVKFLSAAAAPPGEALPGWEILCRIAKAMGKPGFDFLTAAEIRAEMAGQAAGRNRNVQHAGLAGPARRARFPRRAAGALGGRAARAGNLLVHEEEAPWPAYWRIKCWCRTCTWQCWKPLKSPPQPSRGSL